MSVDGGSSWAPYLRELMGCGFGLAGWMVMGRWRWEQLTTRHLLPPARSMVRRPARVRVTVHALRDLGLVVWIFVVVVVALKTCTWNRQTAHVISARNVAIRVKKCKGATCTLWPLFSSP